MATIPIYTSKQNITSQRKLESPGPQQSSDAAAAEGMNLAKMGGAVGELGQDIQKVGNYFLDLQTKTQKDKANTEAFKKVKEIQLKAYNSPDPVKAMADSKAELDAVGQSLAPTIANSIVRDQFTNEFEMEKASASFNIDNHAQARIVQEKKLSLDMRMEDLKEKWHGATSPEIKNMTIQQMQGELFASIKDGVNTERSAMLKLKGLKSDLHKEYTNHALVEALKGPTPRASLQQEMDKIEKDTTLSRAEKDEATLAFYGQMKKAEATENARQEMSYVDTYKAVADSIERGDKEGAYKILDSAKQNKDGFTLQRTAKTKPDEHLKALIDKAFSTPEVTDKVHVPQYKAMYRALSKIENDEQGANYLDTVLEMAGNGILTPVGVRNLLTAKNIKQGFGNLPNRNIMSLEEIRIQQQTDNAARQERNIQIERMLHRAETILGSDPKAQQMAIDDTIDDFRKAGSKGNLDATIEKNAKKYSVMWETVKGTGADAGYSIKTGLSWFMDPLLRKPVDETKSKNKDPWKNLKAGDPYVGKNGKTYIVTRFENGVPMMRPKNPNE